MGLHRQQGYDIIFIDYKLPGKHGQTFFKKIQELRKDAIKILITAYKTKEVVSEARQVGIQGFIDKRYIFDAIDDSLL